MIESLILGAVAVVLSLAYAVDRLAAALQAEIAARHNATALARSPARQIYVPARYRARRVSSIRARPARRAA